MYFHYDNIYGVGLLIIKYNTKVLIVRKEVREKFNINKTKYMLISRDQDKGRNKNIKICNIFLKNLNVQNQEEIKNRLKSGNACCHSVKVYCFSAFLSKKLRIKLYRNINFCCFMWK